MKRLHIVGRSKDRKRLFLARSKDAKSGSFEVPVTRKLLGLIEHVRDGRTASKSRSSKGSEVKTVRVLPKETAREPEGATVRYQLLGGAEPPPRTSLGELLDDIDIPIGTEGAGRRLSSTEKGEAELSDELDSRRDRWVGHRSDRPSIPTRSSLSAAEIQALIRAGRGVRWVARTAGTPQGWVRYLAEPIRHEQMGVVGQMLGVKQARARLGKSGEPIGVAVAQNLRGRGMRDPERIVERRFTAYRPNGREWRVRLAFQHRGRRYTATWEFDPRTSKVVPLNELAVKLGWRRASGDGSRRGRRGAGSARTRRKS